MISFWWLIPAAIAGILFGALAMMIIASKGR